MSNTAPVIRGNSLYTIVDGPLWTTAEANASKIGGNLVAVSDEIESDYLAREFSNFDKYAIYPHGDSAKTFSHWIGLTDRDNEGDWLWSNGEPLSYQPIHWANEAWIYQKEGVYGTDQNFARVTWNVPEAWTGGIQIKDFWQDYPNDGLHGTIHATPTGIAEIPFIRRGDSAYVIVEGPTWEEAEANAIALGGHLVTINDAEENEWLHNFANIQSIPHHSDQSTSFYWTGLNDSSEEGVWQWSSGESITYTNWADGEPSEGGNSPHGEDFVHLGWARNYQWNDFPSQGIIGTYSNHLSRHLGIAEIPLAPNNAPTGTPALTGDFKVGQTISIDASAIEDADNFEGWTPNYEYSWEVSGDNGTTWSALTGADATDGDDSYTLTSAEVGKQLRGVVSYLDGYGTNEAVASNVLPIQNVPIINNVPTGDLTLNGITRAGQQINLDASSIDDEDGISSNFSYSWQLKDDNSGEWLVLNTTDGLDNDANLTLTSAMIGRELRGRASYTDGNGLTEVVSTEAFTVSAAPLEGAKTQVVSFASPTLSYAPESIVTLPLHYTTGNGDNNLSGLTLNVHYNSNILTPAGSATGVSNLFGEGNTEGLITDSVLINEDASNSDGDPLTDQIIQLTWFSFSTAFPGGALPEKLADVSFTTSDQKNDPITGTPLTTAINLTADTAIDYSFTESSAVLTATPFSLDVDGDGRISAFGDGLMVIRKLLGASFDGDKLTDKAKAATATLSTSEIHDFIQAGIDSQALDLDRDGRVTAFGDGLMLIRSMLGSVFNGEKLIDKALSPNSPYYGQADAWQSVKANIDAIMPEQPVA